MKNTVQKKILKKDITEYQDKVTSAMNFVTKKLSVDLNIQIQCMSPYSYKKKFPNAIVAISRSGRGLEDRLTFLLEFNPMVLKSGEITFTELKRHVFHELLHALTWPFIDEQNATIDHIKNNKPLKDELHKRMLHVREDIIYNLERKLGPHVLPECNWTTEK